MALSPFHVKVTTIYNNFRKESIANKLIDKNAIWKMERTITYHIFGLLSKREECLSSYAILDRQALRNHIPNF